MIKPSISILERYILREFLSSFLIAIGVITGILFIGSSFKLLSSVHGLDLVSIIEVSPLILPYVIIHAMPLAALIGSLNAYCRLSADREIMAMKLTGVSFTRLITPILFIGVLLSFLSLTTNNHLAPYCRNQLNRFKRHVVTKFITKLSESRNHIEYEGYKFHWKTVKEGRLHDIVVYKVPRQKVLPSGLFVQADPNELGQILHAKNGTFRLDPFFNLIKFELEGMLGFYDLAPDSWEKNPEKATGKDPGTRPGQADRLRNRSMDRKVGFTGRTFAITIDLERIGARDDIRTKVRDRDIDDLMSLRARDLAIERISRTAIDVEVFNRLSLALSNLSMALLGAALGLIFRGHGRVLAYLSGFGGALLIYHPLTRIGETAAEAGVLPPVLSLQFGNITLWILAFVLIRRGAR